MGLAVKLVPGNWDAVSENTLVIILRSMLRTYKEAEFQDHLEKISKRCQSDKVKQLMFLGPALDEVQGDVFLKFDLIDDVEEETVERAVLRFHDVVMEHSKHSQQVRALWFEILTATKQTVGNR